MPTFVFFNIKCFVISFFLYNFAENFQMEFGKLYIEWIKYLKQKGLYPQYRYDYARTNEYLNARDALIITGNYWCSDKIKSIRKINYRFFNCKDKLIADKGENLSFYTLSCGMSTLMWYIGEWEVYHTPHRSIDWRNVLREFGEENNYVKRQRKIELWSDSSEEWYYPESSAATTARISNSTMLVTRTRYQDAHTGQWYDRYYNRGRNNNIRLRR